MYKAIFYRRDSNDVYQTHTETDADLNSLIDTVFTNVEGVSQGHFVEDLCCELYKQVDGDWQRQLPGSDDYAVYETRWVAEHDA